MKQPLEEVLPLPPDASLPSFLPPSYLLPRVPLALPSHPKIPFPFPFKWLPSRQHESKKTECDSTKGNVTSGCIPTLKFLSHEVASGRSIATPSRIQADEMYYLGLIYQKLLHL